MKADPLVSIRCLVYNHEPFLRQCLDGFVMQQTTFPFEAIVHDDASTDGSAAIIREYAEKYPEIIKPIFETENQNSKYDGSLTRIMDAAIHPNAKYIATCEGDDFWTDPNKLQLQVDFLESHPDYVASSHNFLVYHEDSKVIGKNWEPVDDLSYEIYNNKEFHTFTNDDYYDIWFLQTLSTLRRRIQYVDDDIRAQYPIFYDYIFFYYVTKKGKIAYFKKCMATYRIHKGGVCSGSSVEIWNENYLKNCYVLYKLEGEKRVIPSMNQKFIDLFMELLKRHKFKRAIYVFYRHQKNISTYNSILCVIRIAKIKLIKMSNKLKRMVLRIF